jgi:small-conductance mechanosensitive channel
MTKKERSILIALLVLLAAATIGLLWTRPEAPQLSLIRKPNRSAVRKRDLVDEQPVQTARTLATFAYTRDEHSLARRAVTLADDEVDLAFATALRDTAVHPRPVSDETKGIEQRIGEVERQIADDQRQLDALKNLPAKRTTDETANQIELAEAQLALDREDLADARQDLIRAGGDIQSTLKRMLDDHEATHNLALELPSADPASESWPLLSHWRAWRTRRGKQDQIAAAEREAETALSSLTRSHDELAQRIQMARSGPAATVSPQSPAAAPANSAAALRALGEDMKSLADYDKRIQDERELSDTYRDWGAVIGSYQRRSGHDSIECVLWILLIGFGALIATHLAGRLHGVLPLERRRLRSLQWVARFAIQVAALLLMLLAVFGAPGEITTMLGLAGAGLTVALKDFIVAFFGWFVLMGKNGIRVGDWVEIDGIGGEVVEIGFLRTVLLETGQWSDAGHPTGRKVAFVNSFAVEGHYFNFSTTGQWLWDELEVLVPPGKDPYHVLQAIQEIVAAETAPSARDAEQEWQRAASGHALQSFSAAPAINLRPTNQGIEVVIRYVARAHQRYELRGRLYNAIVEVLRNAQPAPYVRAATPDPHE